MNHKTKLLLIIVMSITFSCKNIFYEPLWQLEGGCQIQEDQFNSLLQSLRMNEFEITDSNFETNYILAKRNSTQSIASKAAVGVGSEQHIWLIGKKNGKLIAKYKIVISTSATNSDVYLGDDASKKIRSYWEIREELVRICPNLESIDLNAASKKQRRKRRKRESKF